MKTKLTDEQCAAVSAFLQTHKTTLDKITAFMLDYNKHTNLTRITEPDEIIEKHYVDSILPLMFHVEHCKTSVPVSAALPPSRERAVAGTTSELVPDKPTVLDVGSGAGFPGIPMKLLLSELQVTLLDSARKRTDYLQLLLAHIGLSCNVVTARSEALAHNPAYREKYDIVTARAVANLASLCEYCLPFVKVGGVFLALKGESAADEVKAARTALQLLGGEVESVREYSLPCGDKRGVVIIRKIATTLATYPRQRVNIGKCPL